MKEDFIINITGIQTYVGHGGDDDYDDKIEIDTLGGYSTKRTARYITYNQMDTDNKNKSVLSIVKVENGCVTMSKTGSRTKLVLEPGQQNVCAYDTPYGLLTMGIRTHEIKQNLNDDGGELFVRYSIYLNSMISTRNTVHIKIRRAET